MKPSTGLNIEFPINTDFVSRILFENRIHYMYIQRLKETRYGNSWF